MQEESKGRGNYEKKKRKARDEQMPGKKRTNIKGRREERGEEMSSGEGSINESRGADQGVSRWRTANPTRSWRPNKAFSRMIRQRQ